MASVTKIDGYIINPNGDGDEYNDIDLEYLIETYTDGWGVLNQETRLLDIDGDEFEKSTFNSSDKKISRIACDELFQTPLSKYQAGDVQVFEFEIDEDGNTAYDLDTTIKFYNEALKSIPEITPTILLPSCIKTSVWSKKELVMWRDLVDKLLDNL